MGDTSGSGQPPGSSSTSTPGPERHNPGQPILVVAEQRDSQDQYGYDIAVGSLERVHPSLQSPFPQQFCPSYSNTQTSSPQSNMAPAQLQSHNLSFGMASLNTALQGVNYEQPYAQQHSLRFPPGPSNTVSIYQLQQTLQLQEPAAMNQHSGPQHNVQYPQVYQGMYGYQQVSTQVQQSSSSPRHQYATSHNLVTPGPTQPVSQYYYPAMMGQLPHGKSPAYQTSPLSPYTVQYGGRGSLPGDACLAGQSQSGNENLGATGWQGGGVGVRLSSIGVFANLMLVRVSRQVQTIHTAISFPKLLLHADNGHSSSAN
jgi:hypothetical protein